MNATLIYVEEAPTITATSADMRLEFKSGDQMFRFVLTKHAAIMHRVRVMEEGWPVLCAPDAPVIAFPKPTRRTPKRGQQ